MQPAENCLMDFTNRQNLPYQKDYTFANQRKKTITFFYWLCFSNTEKRGAPFKNSFTLNKFLKIIDR
jgi:hypothetical protein